MEENHEQLEFNSEEIEAHLSAMDSPTQPWYLSTKAMFRVVNKATASLKKDSSVFHQSMHGLSELIKLLNTKSAQGSLYINLEKAQALIDKLDAIRSDQFAVLNDGYDQDRTELSTVLRNLIASITEQKRLAASYLSKKAAMSHEWEPNGITVEGLTETTDTAMNTYLQQAHSAIQKMLFELQVRYPAAFAKASQIVADGLAAGETGKAILLEHTSAIHLHCSIVLQSADMRILLTCLRILQEAQPLVHSACQSGLPWFCRLSQWAEPYLQRTQPFLDTLWTRVEQYRHSTFAGPYVAQALDRTTFTVELAKVYCIAGDPALFMQVATSLGVLPATPALPALPALPAQSASLSIEPST